MAAITVGEEVAPRVLCAVRESGNATVATSIVTIVQTRIFVEFISASVFAAGRNFAIAIHPARVWLELCLVASKLAMHGKSRVCHFRVTEISALLSYTYRRLSARRKCRTHAIVESQMATSWYG